MLNDIRIYKVYQIKDGGNDGIIYAGSDIGGGFNETYVNVMDGCDLGMKLVEDPSTSRKHKRSYMLVASPVHPADGKLNAY